MPVAQSSFMTLRIFCVGVCIFSMAFVNYFSHGSWDLRRMINSTQRYCRVTNGQEIGGGGNVAQLVEHRTGTLPKPVWFPDAARDFSPRVNFQCRLSYRCPYTPLCAIACFYICVHVIDPVVHARVRWIMETLKRPACTLGWVARLCRRWLFLGKAIRLSRRRNPIGTIQM